MDLPMIETEITTNVSTREGAPPPQPAEGQGGAKGTGQQDQQSAANLAIFIHDVQ